jgi:hypothetical protein
MDELGRGLDELEIVLNKTVADESTLADVH